MFCIKLWLKYIRNDNIFEYRYLTNCFTNASWQYAPMSVRFFIIKRKSHIEKSYDGISFGIFTHEVRTEYFALNEMEHENHLAKMPDNRSRQFKMS